jgi:glycosyltransferase involved in cell wall biosynthesis
LSGDLEARLHSIAGVVPAGFVEDLAATMAAASLSIAPIRFGTGTRVKIIESFALGCPVVSTTLGAEGIEASPGADILIGDSPADFARGCITLLRDPAAQARVGAGGYEIAATRYNEGGRRRELADTLAGLLEKCAGRGARKKTKSPGKIAAL